jgi:hypothetical protein
MKKLLQIFYRLENKFLKFIMAKKYIFEKLTGRRSELK